MEKTVYDGQFVKVNELKVENYTWEKAYFPDSLVIFPFTDNDEVIMIEEKRPHEDIKVRLKFVTGHIDPGESPADCANRELQEEVGFKAQHMKELMVHKSRGTINSDFYYFQATGLSVSKLPNPDGEDTIVSIKKFKFDELIMMLEDGKLDWTIATLGLFKVLSQRKKNN
jgi:ADP-ribose pyrophosphatase